MSGVGSVIVGWVMFGGGAAASATALLAWSLKDDAETNPNLTVEGSDAEFAVIGIGGALIAAIGLGIAIHGHGKVRESRKRRLEWEKTRGVSARGDLGVVPVVFGNGAGAALVGSF